MSVSEGKLLFVLLKLKWNLEIIYSNFLYKTDMANAFFQIRAHIVFYIFYNYIYYMAFFAL